MVSTHPDPEMDSYQLRCLHIGPQAVIETSSEHHAKHVMARMCLIDAGNFERRYELLLGNFLAFEEFCAVSQLRVEVEMVWGYEHGDALMMQANRHIINVFTSGKAYVDQVVRDFKFLGGDDGFSNHAAALIHASYDQSFDYRLTCQLRDRAQHRALPVDGFDAGSKPAAIMFFCSKAQLAADPGKFKKVVLEKAPEKIDLRSTLRGYMKDVSRIHIELRAKVQPEIDKSRAIFETSIKEYIAAQEDPSQVSKTGIGLASVHFRENVIVESIPLLLNWDDTRKRLAEKNRYKINL